MCVWVASLQNGSSNTIATFSNAPNPTLRIAARFRFGSFGSNAIVRDLSTPSGTVTTTCEPWIRLRFRAPVQWTITPRRSCSIRSTRWRRRTSVSPAIDCTSRR